MMRSHQGTTFQAQADLRDTLSTRTHSMISGHTRGNRDTMTSHDSGHTRGHRDTMIDVVARARDADVAEFQGAYIDYELLMALVDDIVDCRRAAEQAFAKELEKQWAKCVGVQKGKWERGVLATSCCARKTSDSLGRHLLHLWKMSP